MARTHSSYTASPTRWRSPQRSPRRDTSEGGSQYEMDLDALGLNSTFESTEMDEKHQPKVDVVETSDIEGPDDFTMNMTYWMTADLPLAQHIRSRKEANTKIIEVRGDARCETDDLQEIVAAGDRVAVEGTSQESESEVEADVNPASTTTRVNGTAKSRASSKALSEASMENEEKVRSYLSALPDTELGGDVLTSTPLRIPKPNMLQVPSPSPARARSLQPTVEDYDTPRKPTQETVIHHPPERIAEVERESLRQQIAGLQSRLQEEANASKTRIIQLETLLSYTRSDLDTARSESYKQKERIGKLQEDNDRQRLNLEASRASVDSQLKAQYEEYNTKMQEFGEELQLQNLAKLQSQREEFERQLRALEEAKRAVNEEMAARGELLERVQGELSQLRELHEQGLQDMRNAENTEKQPAEHSFPVQGLDWERRLAAVQMRADTFQADLKRVNAELQSAREENLASHNERISDLQAQIVSLQSQAASAQENLTKKDRELQDKQVLESQLCSLRVELEDVRNKEIANEQTHTQYTQLESRLQMLKAQLDSARNDNRTKDQEALKQFEVQEKLEQSLHAAQGRIESLEALVSSLRQQIGEAHRGSAKARTDAEQFEGLLEDANERLQDARAEADRRVADVEMKLSKLRDLKAELENGLKERLKELQTEHDQLKQDHETQMEAVRDKAEDAIRKAGSLLDQERVERRRATKELKKTTHELERLRAEVAQKATDEESSEDENSVLSSTHTDSKDVEIENLRLLVRKQASSLKTLKSETSTLRKETTRLKTLEATSQHETITDLQCQLDSLRRENESLKTDAAIREQDFQAINKAMDERLATMLSKTLKERTKTAVNKRDGQWAEKMQGERELMGKVLMREWGRQEVGVAKEGEKQGYRYKYVQRR
ncbi:hypothetical protein N0V90_008842 [Kalmusia sp. IMI 367209]|nr:hypothetical protein N0V90_008842 [Kalmusia sp. IMI 367209]